MNIIRSRFDPEPQIFGSFCDRMAGFFKIEAIRPDGRRRLVADWQPNLITNSGMDLYSTTNRDAYVNHQYKWMRWCRLGTGVTAPAFTDTALASHLASAGYVAPQTNGVYLTAPPYYKWTKTVYRFAQGVATGTIREIGVGQQIGYGPLATRQLILDSNGDPTSIIITADEQVDVTYEMRMYIPDVTIYDAPQAIINGVAYNVKSGPSRVDEITGDFHSGNDFNIYGFKGTTLPNIGTYLTGPSDNFGNGGSVRESYTSGSFTQVQSLTLAYTDWYWGTKGLTAVQLNGISSWQMSFTRASDGAWGIPHDNTNELYIRFRSTWARYTPP